MTDTTNKTPTEILAPDVTTPEVVPAQAPKQGKPTSLWTDAWKELRRKPSFIISAVIIIIMVVMAIFPQLFTSVDPRDCSLIDALQTPNAEHRFGTDLQGCDYYARTVYGARTSVSIGLVVTFFATLIAVTLGSLSGYRGGWFDSVMSRITDIWFAIPLILAGIVFLNALGSKGFWTVCAVLIVFGWPTMLRLMRSSVLSVRELDYIDAARALGASDWRIITRHVLPNGITPVIVYATITVGVIISAEATLSFLNVGLQLPAISWGLMIS
ncbi:MAG TPA: ABC transporter permease, partial [Acidimicrobiia bacterium]|nr:ABC transporter permease [Acidimicrobiia bacterium]